MSLDVGAHLKAVRQMYGLSQRELAKRAGVTNGLISLIEQNRVSPSVSSLKKVLDGIPMALADFFTLDLDDLSIAGADQSSLLSHIVFAGERTAVRDVYVAGKPVLEDGRHPLQEEIVRKFRKVQRELWNRVS